MSHHSFYYFTRPYINTVKRLLSNTVREMFGIERRFTTLEVAIFYLLVVITTALAFYLIKY